MFHCSRRVLGQFSIPVRDNKCLLPQMSLVSYSTHGNQIYIMNPIGAAIVGGGLVGKSRNLRISALCLQRKGQVRAKWNQEQENNRHCSSFISTKCVHIVLRNFFLLLVHNGCASAISIDLYIVNGRRRTNALPLSSTSLYSSIHLAQTTTSD